MSPTSSHNVVVGSATLGKGRVRLLLLPECCEQRLQLLNGSFQVVGHLLLPIDSALKR